MNVSDRAPRSSNRRLSEKHLARTAMNDDSTIGDDLRATLAQARWKRDRNKLEASLTDAEKDMRARFDKYMFGPRNVELSGFRVSDPTCLLVFAEAYRLEGREKVHALGVKAKITDQRAAERPYQTAMFTCIGIWMALRGHAEFVRHFEAPVRTPSIPRLPRTWRMHRERIYAGMGIEYVEPQKVVSLRADIAA